MEKWLLKLNSGLFYTHEMFEENAFGLVQDIIFLDICFKFGRHCQDHKPIEISTVISQMNNNLF